MWKKLSEVNAKEIHLKEFDITLRLKSVIKKGKVNAPFSIGFLKQFLHTGEGKGIILCFSLYSNNDTYNFIKHIIL